MKILVIDKYYYPKDLAQMDMYNSLKEEYEIIFADNNNLIEYVKSDNYDYLYLGIFHPWCGIQNLEEILKINKKPIIIDQADNEGFMARKNSKMIYPENSILLSRYLPNEKLSNFWNGKLMLLPWYINPGRFIPQEKVIDISFICTININRLGADRKKMSIDIKNHCIENNLSHVIGENYNDYSDLITKSKAMVIDGSRYCLTQKYIEAALSNCLIIGEKPVSPSNEFKTINLEFLTSKTINSFDDIVLYNKKYVLETFANKNKFLENFRNVISNF